ncbi:MAG: porin [Flavobacteriales bacterium]|nr:porin [Flavobacteriales bacterium]
MITHRLIRAVQIAALLVPCTARAQVTDSLSGGILRFMGYVDAYHAYDFGHSQDDNRPPFLYQYNRHNETDLNLGLLHLTFEKPRVRSAFGLMAGTYPQANLISEPELLRNINEARVGIKLSRNRAIWIDAGVFTSHIGMESAIGIDNWTLTRSIVAENSPYYLSGARLIWTISKKIEIAVLHVNGWQRIRRIQNNTPCFGTQLLWTPNNRVKLNWSTFAGSDTPDSLGFYRVFNNLWFSWEKGAWGIQLSLDAGLQQAEGDSWNEWAGAVCIMKRRFGERFAPSGRIEYYTDPSQVMVPTGTPHGLTAFGYSLGLDLLVAPDAWVRLEGRTFHGVDALFESIHGTTQDNTAITACMAVRF